MPTAHQRPILIAGPTASGKSALALVLARRLNGVIVNADSMQVYRELRVLTARPSAGDEATAPHRLYGHIAAATPYSVGLWLADMAQVLADLAGDGRTPIIVGGTGLYFEALLNGLSPVPEIDPAVRAHWRAEAERIGPERLFAELSSRDPVMAARLRPSDPQRMTRAIEVMVSTGRSLADWQRETSRPLLDAGDVARVVLLPPRDTVYAACDGRFDDMLRAGALAEVAVLAAQHLPAQRPAMRATGVPALLAHLRGELTIGEAAARGKLETRQYAKRQMTWLRGRMAGWPAAATAGEAQQIVLE